MDLPTPIAWPSREPLDPPMTSREVHERAYNVLRDHEARTAIDLTRTNTLRIAVSVPAYDDLRREGGNPHAFTRLTWRMSDNAMLLGGILVVPDMALEGREVRLRTELEA